MATIDRNELRNRITAWKTLYGDTITDGGELLASEHRTVLDGNSALLSDIADSVEMLLEAAQGGMFVGLDAVDNVTLPVTATPQILKPYDADMLPNTTQNLTTDLAQGTIVVDNVGQYYISFNAQIDFTGNDTLVCEVYVDGQKTSLGCEFAFFSAEAQARAGIYRGLGGVNLGSSSQDRNAPTWLDTFDISGSANQGMSTDLGNGEIIIDKEGAYLIQGNATIEYGDKDLAFTLYINGVPTEVDATFGDTSDPGGGNASFVGMVNLTVGDRIRMGCYSFDGNSKTVTLISAQLVATEQGKSAAAGINSVNAGFTTLFEVDAALVGKPIDVRISSVGDGGDATITGADFLIVGQIGV